MEKRLSLIIDRVHMINNLSTTVCNVCEKVGDNILGVEPSGDVSEKATLSCEANGSLNQLSMSLDELEVTVRRSLLKAERLESI